MSRFDKYRPGLKAKKTTNWELSPIVDITGKIPKFVKERIQKMAGQRGELISTLVGRAIMNELYTKNGFEENYEIEESLEIKELYVQKLISFLMKYPGLSLDHILMFREEIGITKGELLLSYGYLVDERRIKVVKTKYGYNGVHYTDRIPI